MHLAVFHSFAASKSEPLAQMFSRVHASFVSAGFEPVVRLRLADATQFAGAESLKRVSAVARVLKRFPHLQNLVRAASGVGVAGASATILSNVATDGTVTPVDFATLEAIAAGVPRSYPFHGVLMHLSAPGFSEGPDLPDPPAAETLRLLMRAGVDIAGMPTTQGVAIKDAWWVNGRNRALSALRIVTAEPGARKLPGAAAVYAACGKIRKTAQVPVLLAAADAPAAAPAEDPAAAAAGGEAIRALVRDWRERLKQLAESLPNDVPADPPPEARHVPSGPKKPELERVFGPLGYGCKGATGVFRLRRRTSGNQTVEIELDVGTWSDLLTARFRVMGLTDGRAYKAALSLPPSRHARRGEVNGVELIGQFPIAGPDRWRRLVENLGALTARLDAEFVPAVAAIAGPSPAWYEPPGA